MILIIDNYDSFVYNLVQTIGCHDPNIVVLRNDEVSVVELSRLHPDGLVISPGPGTPDDAGISCAAISLFGPQIPVLGVCLGLQCIAEVYGGQTVRAELPMHGKPSRIHHGGRYLFAGLPCPLEVMRYHSLVTDPSMVPACLQVTAETGRGEIMGLRHQFFDVEGVQFHPESIFTQDGTRLIENFVSRVQRRVRPPHFEAGVRTLAIGTGFDGAAP